MATCAVHHPSSDPDCFRCKLVSVGFGYTYGRENFHERTLGETQRDIVTNYKKIHGQEPEHTGYRHI